MHRLCPSTNAFKRLRISLSESRKWVEDTGEKGCSELHDCEVCATCITLNTHLHLVIQMFTMNGKLAWSSIFVYVHSYIRLAFKYNYKKENILTRAIIRTIN